MKLIMWKDGQENRPVKLYNPCPCGCDLRDDRNILGYISGSDDKGNGFTLHLYTKKEIKLASKLFPLSRETKFVLHN